MLVKSLDAVILTSNDLLTMREGVGTPSHRIVGEADEPPVVAGYQQHWDDETQTKERIRIRYWLFGSVADAQAAAEWRNLVMRPLFQTESTAADIIGDTTWHSEDEKSATLWFVKNNVLVHILGQSDWGNQLALTRLVARKIEAKINAVLNLL